MKQAITQEHKLRKWWPFLQEKEKFTMQEQEWFISIPMWRMLWERDLLCCNGESLLKDTWLIRTLDRVPTLYKIHIILPLKDRHLTNQDKYFGPNGVCSREIPL